MSVEKRLTVDIPEPLKLRLDLYAFYNKILLKDAVIKILDETLPKYEVTS